LCLGRTDSSDLLSPGREGEFDDDDSSLVVDVKKGKGDVEGLHNVIPQCVSRFRLFCFGLRGCMGD
jgi:hypothetical protein